jgi:GMP synthase (glutamine-hydrolysing)
VESAYADRPLNNLVLFLQYMRDDSTPAIAVFDASLGETPAERNLRRELGMVTAAYKLSEGEPPPPPPEPDAPDLDGVVISGSQTAVYEDRPWIRDVEAWVRAAGEVGVPVLGICWGHQLIARALGGEVDPMDRYELGYERVYRLTDDPLFAGIGESFVAFETHSDEVTRLPTEATVLAENETSIQAFRIGDAWGVQFHPEYDLQTADWVTEGKRGEVPEARLAAVRADLTPERHAETAGAKRVFGNFRALATTRANTPVTGRD